MRTSKYQKARRIIMLAAAGTIFLQHPASFGAAQETLIFPIPQQMEITDAVFRLDESLAIFVPENATGQDISLARFLVRELSDKYGVAVKIESSSKIPPGRKVVVMGSADNPLISRYCAENRLVLTGKDPGPEGYILLVDADKIIIAGSDDQGAFYGLQSLRQLMHEGNGRSVRGVKVRDWPRLPFRGIRLYVPGPENIAFFKRFLRDFMALYKYNKVIMETNCMRLDRHPEVNAGWIEFSKELYYSRSNSTEGLRGEEKNSSHYDAGDGFIIEKDDVRDIVELATENYIEVIPEIPSLTHGYYLLTRHPELAEYPGDRWPDTYCPSNPASYDLMFDVYDEYIEVMHPKMVHIGHDEWWGAPMGVCPLCRDKNYPKLFADDVIKIHDYFASKGIKIAMWGDYLLESVRDTAVQNRVSSTGVKYRTPGAVPPEIVMKFIPKDILIFNWFWVNQERDLELEKFGFTQLYGNFKPNISNWDERIKKIHLAGGAPSSWASTNEFNFGKDLLLNFLGCANLVWSSHTLDQVELGSIVRKLMPYVRSNLSTGRIPSEDGDQVVPVDILEHYNFSRDESVFGVDLNSMQSGEVRIRSKVFRLASPGDASGKCAVAVSSVGTGDNPLSPEVNGISINEDVSSLIFLHACALPAGNQKAYFNIPDFFDTADLLGWYEIVYEDGYRVIVPVRYGVNILEWNPGGENSLDLREGRTGSAQDAYCYRGDALKCSLPGAENPVTFYAFEWVNPRFGKKIREVNLHGSVNYQAQQRDYGTVVSAPMSSNAILLAAISKVVRREPIVPMALYRSSDFTPAGSFTSGAEGPAVDAAGNLYAVNYAREGTVGKISPDGRAEVYLDLPEGSTGNGIRFDSRGNMFIADYMGHKVYRVEGSNGRLSVHADVPRMKQPNDLAVDGKGRLYASDPDWEAGTGKIWRIDTDGSAVLLEEGMGTVNGIEVGPGDDMLYVNETLQRRVWAYDLSPGGDISHKRLLVEFPDYGLDGMRCDTAGNLYIARYGKGTVVKLSPEGRVLKEITLSGKKTSNIAFGGYDGCTAYVTVQDRGNIETFLVDTPGREWAMSGSEINGNIR